MSDGTFIKGPALVSIVDHAIKGSVVAVRLWLVVRTSIREARGLTLEELAESTDLFEDLTVDASGGLVVDLREVV